ncbi:MAG: hypothetical protein JWO84_736 [Parcubacteria group bacterium]|nr:hypothetical protein [Parcubacteria group bacterium]
MRIQVLIIHGGSAFDSYEAYLTALTEKEITLDRIRTQGGWKNTLQARLGEDYEVLQPRMPNGQNAKYAEWKIWFEKILPLLDDEVILVGHSLGGIFLAKYLSEHEIEKRIAGAFLVAAPFNTLTIHPVADFNLTTDLSGLARQCEKIFLYQSEDDTSVPFSNLASYTQSLPDATVRVFEDRGHFLAEDFPELIKDITTL